MSGSTYFGTTSAFDNVSSESVLQPLRTILTLKPKASLIILFQPNQQVGTQLFTILLSRIFSFGPNARLHSIIDLPPLPRPDQQRVWPMRHSPDNNRMFVDVCFRHLAVEGEHLRSLLATLLSMDWFFNGTSMDNDTEQLVQHFVRRIESKECCCLFCATKHAGPAAAIKCAKSHFFPH